jgi:DNA replicative helicase MCM subunit Mcm2 (Cdc46/Mcm family)
VLEREEKNLRLHQIFEFFNVCCSDFVKACELALHTVRKLLFKNGQCKRIILKVVNYNSIYKKNEAAPAPKSIFDALVTPKPDASQNSDPNPKAKPGESHKPKYKLIPVADHSDILDNEKKQYKNGSFLSVTGKVIKVESSKMYALALCYYCKDCKDRSYHHLKNMQFSDLKKCASEKNWDCGSSNIAIDHKNSLLRNFQKITLKRIEPFSLGGVNDDNQLSNFSKFSTGDSNGLRNKIVEHEIILQDD